MTPAPPPSPRAPGDPRRLGATLLGDGEAVFRVWAPHATRVEVVLADGRRVPASPAGHGYAVAVVRGLEPGARYGFSLDGGPTRPDPASRAQPGGVHELSALAEDTFPWTDAGWTGRPLRDEVLYELHVGTFTAGGTLRSAIDGLDRLVDLGVTTVEVMPVAAFGGDRGWGYDGVHPFCVHEPYGGLDAFRAFVDGAHARGLCVVLDVVYNHLGPEGNYLREFGPYFTDDYRTPWGAAVNVSGPLSDHVRRYLVENALWWLEGCHVDGLRLDAVHAIVDPSAQPLLGELAATVHARATEVGRTWTVVAESDLNDARLVRPTAEGGLGLDGVWSDEFHHAVHALLTDERDGYYADFGSVEHVAEAFRHGFVHRGQYSAYRGRRHGNDTDGVPAWRFVACIQNHDQVGNRMRGERLGSLVSFEAQKLAAALLLLSPFVPLLFMGEEYGEPAPFPYFVGFTDPDLVRAVREGRQREFAAFTSHGEPPDPADPATYAAARLHPELAGSGQHAVLQAWYRSLIAIRRRHPGFGPGGVGETRLVTTPAAGVLLVDRTTAAGRGLLVANAGQDRRSVPLPAGPWATVADSASVAWAGPLPAARTPDATEVELPPESVLACTALDR